MTHEIDRILDAAASGAWAIDPIKAREILGILALRAAEGPNATRIEAGRQAQGGQVVEGTEGRVHVVPLHGTILPRGSMMSAMSGSAGLNAFQQAFREAAEDPNAAAIVLDVDSPGGRIDLVPETAAMVAAARSADRPVVAVANTLAASAAYWIAAAADELVVTPSGTVGSIGVYTMHDDLSGMLKAQGVKRTVISEGARKVELAPFGPMSAEARAALQREVRATYDAFTADVARFRGVDVSVVRADPEDSPDSFGGGRAYHAQEAVRRGMADRVATLQDTLAQLAGRRRPRRTGLAARKLRLS